MSQTARKGKPATYEDLLKLPENVIGEIVDGELYVSPRPSPKHALATSSLNARIGGSFGFGEGGPGGWWIIVEPELHLGKEVLVPDIAGWKKQRLPKIPDTPYFELVPDWVCEVLSPSNARIDRVKKVPRYADQGVAHLWLVDPLARTLEVFKLENRRWFLHQVFGEREKVRAEPFDAIEIDLWLVWGESTEAEA